MTERGLPIVDGAPACPFVAFDEDRDGRALAPDHRHRCYAEARPAPRALAHQEAYCLSSAFPVCPTFQDWARREAAAARPPQPAPREEREWETPPPVSRPMPPLDREPRHAPGDLPPRRNPHRDWAAPPPWTGEGPDPAEAGDDDEVAAPPFLAGRGAEPDRWGSEGRGLAGSAADRLAGGELAASRPPDRVPAGHAPYAPRDDEGEEDDEDDEEADGGWVAAAPALPARRVVERPAQGTGAGRRDSRRDDHQPPGGHVRRPPEEPSDLFGPAWERPQRYEAYPTLRTRMGLPSIPRVGVAAAALVLAALALFFLGPRLLGIGEPDDPGPVGPGASPSGSVAPSASVDPTPTPAPTPQVYVVASGDTLSKIATMFGLTLDEILAANPQITNADRIAIGDEIIIPAPLPTSVPNELPGGGSPSP